MTMREEIEHIKPGDPISASKHLNPAFSVANRFARFRPGSFVTGQHSASHVGECPPFPAYLTIVEIVDLKINESDDPESGLYKVYERYYLPAGHDDELGMWKTNAQPDRKFILDARESPNYRLLVPMSRLAAWWHVQRGSFVSVFIPNTPLAGKPASSVANNSIGTYKIERMTNNGFVPLLAANGEQVLKEAYNQSGIEHLTSKRYRLDMFAGSDFLSSFPYQVQECA